MGGGQSKYKIVVVGCLIYMKHEVGSDAVRVG